MGFLSTLGQIGAGIAAPFTGGASLAAIPALGALGSVASGAAKGSADQRLREGDQTLGYNRLLQQQAGDTFTAGNITQDRERKAALLQALLSGLQDFQVTPGNPAIASAMGQRTGGLRPSALTANSDILMQLLGQPSPRYAPPDLAKQPTAGWGEKLLGGIGLGGSLLGALGGLKPPTSRPMDERQGMYFPSNVNVRF